MRSEGLVPSFPTKTFPNHYTIVTGLYPHRHGIVLNNIQDPALPGFFNLSNREVQQDTRWWGGVPLWVTAEAQGQIAGTMFWPGSDVEIAGDRPTYWRTYDHEAPNVERVDQILAWMREPDAKRPTFLTLYFSDDRHGGPRAGTGLAADARRGGAHRRVHRAARRRASTPPGTARAPTTCSSAITAWRRSATSAKIVLDDYIDLSTVSVQDWSPVLVVGPRRSALREPQGRAEPGRVDDLYRALKDKHPRLDVHKLSELPDRYRLRGHPRLAPVIGIADDGWDVTSRERMKRDAEGAAGTHGYDPIHQSMHGLFIASGPAFRPGVVVPRFENVHVYELMCRVLGLRPALNDGDPKVTAPFFK